MPTEQQGVGNNLQEAGTRSANGGRVTGLPPHMIGAQESPNCTDTDPIFPWGVKMRNGSALVASFAPAGSGSPVGGLTAIVMNAGSQYIYTGNATTLWVYDVAANTTNSIGIGMSTDSIMQAAILNNQVAIVASGLALQYSSTGTTTLVAIPAGTYLPSFAKYVTGYVSKLWFAGDPGNPSRTSFTSSQNPLDFTTANNAGFIDIGTGDGDVVQGLEGTKNCIYIFKRKNTYAVTGSSVFDFNATFLCRWGLVSPYAHCTDGQGCFFASDDGIYYAIGLNVARLSDSVKVDYDSISDKSTIAMEVIGEKLFVFYKDTGATANSAALVCAYKRKLDNGQINGVWTKYTAQPFQVANASRLSNLYAGTVGSTPQIYKLDTGSSAIGFKWNTPDEDYGDVGVKQLVRYFVHFQPSTQPWNATMQPYADGAVVGNSVTFTVPATGSTSSGVVVGSHYVKMFTPDTNVRGRFIRLEMTSGASTNVGGIFGYRIYCDVRSEGMPRA